jgi:hypothetical protein
MSLQFAWAQNKAMTTAAGAVTTPGVTARNSAAVEALANVAVFAIEPKMDCVVIRAMGVADNSVNVFDVLVMRGNSGDYNRICTLTFTTGTQTGSTSGYCFADQVTVTNSRWHQTISTISGADEYIAEVAFDTLNVTKMVLVPTTIGSNAIVQIAGAEV